MLLSVGQTPEREKVIDFSQPYAPYYLAVFGPKALPVKNAADLAGKSISVARGTLEDLSVTKIAPPTANIKSSTILTAQFRRFFLVRYS
jgi:ABC-type amino acid transport/signal transduction systems, periplasmic component/domain